MHALETLFSQYSLKFQIVSNSVRMHILDTLFLKKLYYVTNRSK